MNAESSIIRPRDDEAHREELIRRITSFLHRLESQLRTFQTDRLSHTYNGLQLIIETPTAREQWNTDQLTIWKALATAANNRDEPAFKSARKRLLKLYGGRHWQNYYTEAEVLGFMSERWQRRLERLANRLEKGAEQ
jgi:hypothetical protein